MAIDTDLPHNEYARSSDDPTVLRSTSMYTKGDGSRWDDGDMMENMMDAAVASIRGLAKDLFINRHDEMRG